MNKLYCRRCGLTHNGKHKCPRPDVKVDGNIHADASLGLERLARK